MIRYFAAARAAAGVSQEQLTVPTAVSGQSLSVDSSVVDSAADGAGAGPEGAGAESTVGGVLDVAVDRHGPGLARVLQRCSYLLDEVAVHGRQTPIRDGQVLDVLPPFAGG
jgi:sulfur-carrier protein